MAERKSKKKFSFIILIRDFIYFLLLLFFNFALFIKQNFHNVGFEQLLFTLTNPDGANYDIVWKGIYFIIGISLGIIIGLFILKKIFRFFKISIIFKFRFKGKKLNKEFCFDLFKVTKLRQIGTFIVILFLGIWIPTDMIDFRNYMKAQKVNTEFFEKYYVDPKGVNINFNGKKKNLVYIYVESLESSATSIEQGGLFEESIIPNLESLATRYINFSGTDNIGGAVQVKNTSWTMAGLVSQTSGIPFKIPIDGNQYSKYSSSLPGAYSLGQVLEKNGYKNYFMMGSDADYGGRKAYFVQHGNYEFFDYYKAIEDKRIEKDYYEWWGYEDKKLFEYAKDKLTEISEKDEPFNFTILTADTHFTDGYMDDSCEEKFDSKYANSFYCSDSKIEEFISWMRKQDFYKDTVIVIVGDHLTMQEGFYPTTGEEGRYLYNVFIHSSVSGNNKNRLFTHFDLYPTTLAAMGATIEGNKLGLGVNLFSGEETILEKLGEEDLNVELVRKSDYYNKNILGSSYYEMLDDVEDSDKLLEQDG